MSFSLLEGDESHCKFILYIFFHQNFSCYLYIHIYTYISYTYTHFKKNVAIWKYALNINIFCFLIKKSDERCMHISHQRNNIFFIVWELLCTLALSYTSLCVVPSTFMTENSSKLSCFFNVRLFRGHSSTETEISSQL